MTDRLDALERLQRLREAGALTQREFESEKQRVLRGADHAAPVGARWEPDEEEEYEEEYPRRRRGWPLPVLGLLVAAGGAAWLAGKEFSGLKPEPTVETAATKEKAAAPIVPKATAPPPADDLSAVLAFNDAARCEYAGSLDKLFDSIVTWSDARQASVAGKPVRVPGFAAPLAPTLARGADDYITASLPLDGHWHGLKVSRLLLRFREETDDIQKQIRFLETPARVRTVLNAEGFKLAEVGRWRPVEPESELPVSMRVSEVPGGAALVCAT